MTLPPRARAALRLDEALWLAVATSVCGALWVGLALAELGHFSLAHAALVLAAGSAAGAALGWRRLGRPWGTREGMVPTLVVLALALGLFARPSEYVVGGRDPGAY